MFFTFSEYICRRNYHLSKILHHWTWVKIMKKILTISFLLLLFAAFQLNQESYAATLSREEIMAELQLLKERMMRLEQALEEIEETPSKLDKGVVEQKLTKLKERPDDEGETVPECRAETSDPEATDNRILRQGERGVVGHWQALKESGEGIELSGAVEIEAGYEHFKAKHEKSEKSSFLELATVELVVDAHISDSLKAHIVIDYEDGEGLDIDEAMLHYQAEDVCRPDCSCRSHWFASLGLMTVPFGYYESHFCYFDFFNS